MKSISKEIKCLPGKMMAAFEMNMECNWLVEVLYQERKRCHFFIFASSELAKPRINSLGIT